MAAFGEASLARASSSSTMVENASRLGVRGVVLKEMACEMLIRRVRRVHEGGFWIERTSAARALARMAGRRERAIQLTHRELDVVRLVLRRMRNREIAERLAIGEGTVKIRLHRVYEKLGVESRLALAAVARTRGLTYTPSVAHACLNASQLEDAENGHSVSAFRQPP